jgi:outer membrane protein OmpA-like peptidoglycan-associated protein
LLKKTTMIQRAILLVALVAAFCVSEAEAQYRPPRIRHVINPVSTGQAADPNLKDRRYYIDRGLTASINKGDIHNVYREKRLVRGLPTPIRVFIDTMIRYKTAMKSDIVVPRLVIDNSVLFDPGDRSLKIGAAKEFDKVGEFVQMFSPAKLIIEGHTDGDGEAEENLILSL